jgi:hypothetical protein
LMPRTQTRTSRADLELLEKDGCAVGLGELRVLEGERHRAKAKKANRSRG